MYNTIQYKYNLAHAKSVKLIDDSQARRLGVASDFESPVSPVNPVNDLIICKQGWSFNNSLHEFDK